MTLALLIAALLQVSPSSGADRDLADVIVAAQDDAARAAGAAAGEPDLEARAARDSASEAARRADAAALGGFDEWFAEQEGGGCAAAQNADAHLGRASRRIALAHALLQDEAAIVPASDRVAVALRMLADDAEMVAARYLVQTLAERACAP
ncbi:hypothetical protein NI454_09095 [Brevundimonas diminuta]|uniref:hypothetical protein n=1 Tax=Brevundimonas diminuta TaxID=293 RepID=UPI0020974B61|nr:hypothetical protein [Brevundimonas diminuta]MCO8030106.1 hypothetical protein [Brevundimonas diminuta]